MKYAGIRLVWNHYINIGNAMKQTVKAVAHQCNKMIQMHNKVCGRSIITASCNVYTLYGLRYTNNTFS